jgi:hypothetical protein
VFAVVAELADAPASGAGGSNPLEVQLFSTALINPLPRAASCSRV